jgi:hypothetical protein
MDNVREWLFWRLMRDFGTVGVDDGSYLEGETKFWPDSTRQWYEWTRIPRENVAGLLKRGVTSCTSFLLHVHRHIVDEGGYKPAGHWDNLFNLKGKGWHEGPQGIQTCDFFQFVPMHVGVFLGAVGNFADYLAGGADRGGVGLLSWSTGPIPPPKYKFMGYLNIEEYYSSIGPGS